MSRALRSELARLLRELSLVERSRYLAARRDGLAPTRAYRFALGGY
jgi:hypothetical protein